MSSRATVLLALLSALLPVAGYAQEYLWCFDEDLITFQLQPDPIHLIIDHHAAMYNCCPEPVSWDVTMESGVIDITENVGVETPCDCICCF